MKKLLIAFAAAGFVAVGLAASPAAAAPLAPKHLGFMQQDAGNLIQEVRHGRRHARGHWHGPRHRHVRRHFWAPGPWAFRGIPYHHCFRVARGGYVCYF